MTCLLYDICSAVDSGLLISKHVLHLVTHGE